MRGGLEWWRFQGRPWVAGFTPRLEGVLLGAETLGNLLWVVDTERLCYLLRLCWARFSSRQGHFCDRWRLGRNGRPLVQLLTEEIGFARK